MMTACLQQREGGLRSSNLPSHYVPGILAQISLLELSLKVGEIAKGDQQLHLTRENCVIH